MAGRYQGACFCGAVEIQVNGEPNAMGYCHCRSCRSWSGGPVNAFSLWPPDAVKVTKGAENVATYAKTELSQRKFCRVCGGHLMAAHAPLEMIDVFAATKGSGGSRAPGADRANQPFDIPVLPRRSRPCRSVA